MSGMVPSAETLTGDTTLSATGGQSVRASQLVMAGDASAVLVDAASTIEIGLTGHAAAGALTVDAGATIDGTTTNTVFPASLFGAVIDNGLIEAAALDIGNSFFFAGTSSTAPSNSLSGSGTVVAVAGGTVEIGGAVSAGNLTFAAAGSAVLRFDGAVGAGNDVVLSGTGDVVRIGAPSSAGLIAFGATIDGFGATDALLLNAGSITGAVASDGTLSLLNGTISVGDLLVQGGSGNETFDAVTLPGAGVELVLAARVAATGISAGTGAQDAYVWTGPLAGAWGDATNWRDVSAGVTPAAVAPGGGDVVTIDGADGIARVIGGAGAALSLDLTGTNAVIGAITAATLSNSGVLVIAAPGTVTAGNVTIGISMMSAAIWVSGAFSASALTLDNASTLAASGGGSVIVSTVTASGDGAGLSVDAGSVIHIGGAGAAATGALTVDRGATLTSASTNDFFPSFILGQVIDNGLISAHELDVGRAYFIAGTAASGPASRLAGTGTIEILAGGTGEVGCAVAAGRLIFQVDPGASLRLDSAVGAGNTVNLSGVGDVLRLGAAGTAGLSGFAAVISGFAAGDTINLVGAAGAAASTVTGPGGTTLALTSNGTPLASLVFAGLAAGGPNFDSAIGTVTVTACFAAGTRLATPSGAARIETLRAGDAVLTWDGGARRIRWVGHRTVVPARDGRLDEVLPVRIRADAFAPGRPARDLFLSPDHAIFWPGNDAPGVLVPVRYLVNGASVARIYVPRITYWHLELDSHDIVLAEGLPTETYLDTGNRAAFANGGSIAIGDLDYSRRIWVERGCAPLAVAGPAVTAVRESLLARLPLLGFRATTDPASRFLADGIPLAPVVDGAWTRLLPLAGARLVTLRSRAAPPSFLDPTRRDDRSLGVMVNAIRLDGVNVDLDDSRLARGWHAPERGWRWTDGAADLVIAGARLVEIAIADGGHAYPVAAPASFGLIRPSAPRGGRHG